MLMTSARLTFRLLHEGTPAAGIDAAVNLRWIGTPPLTALTEIYIIFPCR
jgi:hypothetical protein